MDWSGGEEKEKGENSPPPFLHHLTQLYHSTLQQKRLEKLSAEFQAIFGVDYDYCVRAPGRVNLIGEHIDYSGYGVLPMALEHDTVVLVCRSEGATVQVHNLVSSKYPPRTFHQAGLHTPIDSTKHEWSNYFLAGFKGLLEAVLSNTATDTSVGFKALVHGVVPTGSGLSSSSALVCASALATMVVNLPASKALSKKRLADICMKSERYVGVEGGGMDQAISFLAEKGKAQLIEFNPLRGKDILLPPKATFVIANSLVESNKYVTGSTCYNMRVAECRLAAVLLSFYLQLDWTVVRRLIDVQKQSNFTLGQLAEAVRKHLHDAPYSIEEVATILSLDVPTVVSKYLGTVPQTSSFQLQQRSLHVFEESARVYQFESLCQNPTNETLESLGKLMNESHTSCSELFDCSCPELNTLTAICRKAGALGSRLTGAGWGGCTISLVPEEKVESFMSKVVADYYIGVLKMSEEEVNEGEVLFATQPGIGAAIIYPQK